MVDISPIKNDHLSPELSCHGTCAGTWHRRYVDPSCRRLLIARWTSLVIYAHGVDGRFSAAVSPSLPLSSASCWTSSCLSQHWWSSSAWGHRALTSSARWCAVCCVKMTATAQCTLLIPVLEFRVSSNQLVFCLHSASDLWIVRLHIRDNDDI